MIKSGIEMIVGKTIKAVKVYENAREPRQQLYLFFTDGTNLEFYGDSIHCANDLGGQKIDESVRYAEPEHAEKIEVFGSDKKD